jgi:WD40 repeat protein
VLGLAFSPDGKTFLTGCEDHQARLWRWEAPSAQRLGRPLAHHGYVRAVAFSPDGKTLLTGSWDGTAQCWDTAMGKPIGPPLTHQGWVTSVAFSPDGRTALTGSRGSRDGTARLWEVVSAPLEGTVERIVLWIQVVTGTELDADTQIRVLDASTWQERRQRLEELGGPPVP